MGLGFLATSRLLLDTMEDDIPLSFPAPDRDGDGEEGHKQSMKLLMGNDDPTQGLHEQSSSLKPERFENAVETHPVHVFGPGTPVKYTRHRGDKAHRGVVVDCCKEGYLVRDRRHKKNRSYVPFVQVFGKNGELSYRYEVE